MRSRLGLACFVAFSLLGACSEESGDDGNDQEESPTGEQKLDGGRDASRMDARTDEEEEELDASSDAGRDASVKRDASAVDASRDATARDAEAAPASDASEPAPDASGPEPDARETSEDGGLADAGDSTRCSELTYESFGQPFLAGYCATLCHSSLVGLAGVRLDTLEGVKAAKDPARAAVVNKVMPPLPPGPTDEERARFAAWLDCGPN